MSNPSDPNAARKQAADNLLLSLSLIRSEDPNERKRGIQGLTVVRDDPRVRQVFEHLYEKDADLGVRQEAWRAINRVGPSIPAPGPIDDTPVSVRPAVVSPESRGNEKVVDGAPTRKKSAAAPARPPAQDSARRKADDKRPAAKKRRGQPAAPGRRARRRLFLLNPANARYVATEMRRMARERRKRQGGRTTLILALLLVAAAAVFAGLTLPEWITWYRLSQDGVERPGTLLALEERDGKYYARYEFAPADDPDGATYNDEQPVTEDDFANLGEGDAVTVTYVPKAPEISRLAQRNPNHDRRDRLTAVAGLLVVGAVALLMLRRIRRRRPIPVSVGKGGTVVLQGQVVACSSHVDEDNDFTLKVRYRFKTPSGEIVNTQAGRLRNDLKGARLPKPGTPVAVAYRKDGKYQLL
jgi:hypothetical protein